MQYETLDTTKKSFFINDGWFGVDKIGHFTRHVLMTFLGVLLGGCLWCIVYYDSIFDVLYEYMNYKSGVGFSIRDIIWGRAGMIACLIVARFTEMV